MTAYDTNNIFAKILRGEFPFHKVYEDDHVLAFLDIMPRSPGHTLVIPKAPARNILDITPEDFAHVARGAHKIAAAAMKAFKADGITLQQFNEACGGASGVNSQRSGFMSNSGVSSRQSRPRTSTTFPSMPTSLTIEVPIGFSRTGERSENVPRVDLLFFGLCSTRSRRDRCSQ